MAKDLVWNQKTLGAFKALAILTEEEEAVLNYWAHGKTVVATAMDNHMCSRKVNNIRKEIRKKYDGVQVYTPELPKRHMRS